MQPNNCSPSIHGLKTIGVVQPEWLRVNDAVVVFGLSRPHLFRAIVQDRVKSVHIKNPGAKKGFVLSRSNLSEITSTPSRRRYDNANRRQKKRDIKCQQKRAHGWYPRAREETI